MPLINNHFLFPLEYLFPSGLIDPKARPMMKPPEEIYSKVQDAVFDYAGRPKHNFFYTSKPLYTQSLYDLAENISQVMAFGDRMNRYLIMVNFELL